MALPSTMYRFNLEISDVDRGVYDSVELRVAMHPSESVPYLLTRVLAYALNHQEGLTFCRGGLSQTEDPALYVEDLTGLRTVWIEIGQPTAERLHKASKAVETVRVYVHKALSPWLEGVRDKAVHRAEQIEVVGVPPVFLDALGERLGRSNAWAVVHTQGELFVTIGEETLQAVLSQQTAAG